MTGPSERSIPQRRDGDHGRWGAIRAFWRTWGQLIMGVWLLCVSLIVLIIAVDVRDARSATAEAARVACVRSKEIGPAVVEDYARRHVLTGVELAKYRSLIPKTCPSK